MDDRKYGMGVSHGTTTFPTAKVITLPCFGMVITDHGEIATITSEGLHAEIDEPRIVGIKTITDYEFNAAIDGIESLILAHYQAGIDVQSPAYIEGIETAVEAASNQ